MNQVNLRQYLPSLKYVYAYFVNAVKFNRSHTKIYQILVTHPIKMSVVNFVVYPTSAIQNIKLILVVRLVGILIILLNLSDAYC